MSAENQSSAADRPQVDANASTGDSTLSMFADMEARLAGLRKQHEQTAQRERELAEREQHVARLREELDQQSRLFQEQIQVSEQQSRIREAQAHQEAQSHAELAARLESQQGELALAQANLAVEHKSIADLREELGVRQSEFEQRQLASQEQAQKLRETLHAELLAELSEKAIRQAKEQAQIESQQLSAAREQVLSTRERLLASREASLLEHDLQLQTIQTELDQRDAAAYARAAELVAKQQVEAQALSDKQNQLDEHEARLAARERQLALISVREQALKSAEEEASERQAALAQLSEQMDRERERLQARERELSSAASSPQLGIEAAIDVAALEAFKLKLEEAAAARHDLEAELSEAHEEISQLAFRVRQAASSSAGPLPVSGLGGTETNIVELMQQVSEKQALLVEREATLDTLRQQVAELKASLETQSARAHAADRRAQEALANPAPNAIDPQDLAKRDQAIVLLKQRLDTAILQVEAHVRSVEDAERRASEATAQRNQLASSNDAAEARARELQELAATFEQRAREAQSVAESNATALASHAALTAIPGDEWISRRRTRLSRYKGFLQGQARKIVAAQNALQKRHADCEQILAQRARLVALAQELERNEKRVHAGKARSGTAAMLLYVVASVGLIAGVSWEASRRIWPGTYVAKATIEADARGRSVEPEKLKQWQADAETLIKDPRLMEVVAERMKRRGVEQYQTPADVRELVGSSMSTQSSQPGTLEIDLRGEGSFRTQHVLDTYITALKSVADESRAERAHDLGVNISKSAAASSEPLLDQRIHSAAIVFLGALTGFGVFATLVWSRLSKSKRSFDAKQAAEAALGGADWAVLEQTFKRQPVPTDSDSPSKPKAKRNAA